jgi:AcrR family transcriptional regulator
MTLQIDVRPDHREALGIEHRRARQREEARRAILDATESLLIQSGGFDFSIRSLGKRCGYSAPTVYHYFGDKDGLIDALLEERVAGLADAIERVPRSSDALVELLGVLRVFVEFGHAHPTFNRLMWTVSSKGQGRTTPAMERLTARVRPPLMALAESGRLEGADVESAGQMIWALLHGLSALRVIEPDHPWVPNLGERALETLLRGMTRPARGEASR